jgi:vacuolar-type H+-ATPase subunit E/Vma4
MTYENLLRSVEENAEKKMRELEERAEKAAADIRAEAERRAQEIQDTSLAEAREESTVERNRLMFMAKAESNIRTTEVKTEVYQRVFSNAETVLHGIRNTPQYGEVFRFLAREAADAASERKIEFHVDPRDEMLCKKVLGELNLPGAVIVPDISCIGGLDVSTAGGGTVIRNTIESRLARARDLIKLDVYAILYGGKG